MKAPYTVFSGVLAVLNLIMLVLTLLGPFDLFYVVLFACGASVTGFSYYAEWAKGRF